MERKVVVVGDPPNTGGAVLANDCRATINGVSKALMGGKVRCDACKSVGRIAKAGGPYRAGLFGGEEVLEGDLVLCKCAVMPRLVALAVSSRPPLVVADDRIESLGAVRPPMREFIDLTPWLKPRERQAHSIQFEVRDRKTGELSTRTCYRICVEPNTFYIGMTDENG